MRIERGKTGHAWRYTPKGKINTLYGEGLPKASCNTCKQVKNESEFYHYKNGKSLSVCIECDDKRRLLDAKILRRRKNGVYVDKNLQPVETLEAFFEMEICNG